MCVMKPSVICASFILSIGAAFAATPQELRLEGRFEYRTDQESKDVIGDQVCFFPGSATASLVPREKADRRLVWFCFANTRDAKRMLQIPSSLPAHSCGYAGNAVVTVTSYKVYRGEGDDNDVALLKHVASVSRGDLIKCEQ